jgi:hypothetical protein
MVTTTGGTGATAVEAHNGSEMASVWHSHLAYLPGTSSHALSRDFTYVADDPISFDMQAVATSTSPAGAVVGVSVSFLNAFNISLGGFSLLNSTSPSSLDQSAYQFAIDNLQHHYGATMATFAMQAGLNPSLPISKINLSFVSYANSYGPDLAYGSVWFDNVQVGAVPEPATQALLLAGLGIMAMAARRRHRR